MTKTNTHIDLRDLERTFQRTRRNLLIPVVFVFVFSLAILFGLVIHSANSQNKISQAKSIHFVDSIINGLKFDLGKLNIDHAYWDQAVENLITKFDPIWARDNVGKYLFDTYSIHSTYVLNERDRVIYSVIGGEAKAGNPFARYHEHFKSLISQSRAEKSKDGKPVPVVGIISDGKQVLIASAGVLTTYSYENEKIRNEPTKALLVIFRALTPEMLLELANNLGLKDLQLKIPPDKPVPESVFIELMSRNGTPLATLSWQADDPGGVMLKQVMPIIVVLMVLIVVVFIIFANRARQVSQKIVDEMQIRFETQKQLAHAQKMQALGNLVGGVSHNLNNLMQPILVLSQRLEEGLPAGNNDQILAKTISHASKRAVDLIKQLMMFSRKEVSQRDYIDIHDLVVESIEIINSSLPSNAKLKTTLEEDTGLVLADFTQIQSVLMNLLSNAIDALDGAIGEINVQLLLQHPGENVPLHVAKNSSESVALISVADTGMGMDEKTVRRIFDPFFTTKPQGKGTGLGLSTAFGIIKDHGGSINCSSQPNAGTVFEIRLPLVIAQAIQSDMV